MSPNNSHLILGLVTPWKNSHPEPVASCPPLISSNQMLCYVLCQDLAPRLSNPGSTLREYLSHDGSHPCFKPCPLRLGKNIGMFWWDTLRWTLCYGMQRKCWWIGEVDRSLGTLYMVVCWSQEGETVTETWHLHSWDLNSSWGRIVPQAWGHVTRAGIWMGLFNGGSSLMASTGVLGKPCKGGPLGRVLPFLIPKLPQSKTGVGFT